jgi:hypothetical protein
VGTNWIAELAERTIESPRDRRGVKKSHCFFLAGIDERGLPGRMIVRLVDTVRKPIRLRRKKMKRLMVVLTALFVFSASAFAQMGAGQGGGMTGHRWGWGMGYGWGSGIIIMLLIVVGIVYMMKRK